MKTSREIFDDYVSIVVTSYNRPFYLRTCLESLEKNADMPFEVIIHDDGSEPEQREEIYKICAERASVGVFNYGLNSGLNISTNRAVALAHSRYILFLNDDCILDRPCLGDICNTLSKQYIGYLCPTNEVTITDTLPDLPRIRVGDTSFFLTGRLANGCSIAFRREVWDEVGGFCEEGNSNNADNMFIFKIIRAGYWKGVLPGLPVIGNVPPNAPGYVASGEFGARKRGSDNAYPKIFDLTLEEYHDICARRREYCQKWTDNQQGVPGFSKVLEAGLADIPYWSNYVLDTIKGIDARTINWEACKKHGQDRWKGMILEDLQ